MKWQYLIVYLFVLISCSSNNSDTKKAKQLGDEDLFVTPKDTNNLKNNGLVGPGEIDISLYPQRTTANGLEYRCINCDKNQTSLSEGSVVRMRYVLTSPEKDTLKSSLRAGNNYTIVQGLTMVPKALDDALLDFKEHDELVLKVPALHSDMESFQKGRFKSTDTLTYYIKIQENIVPTKLPSGASSYLIKEGSGKQVREGDRVGLTYYGFLPNGDLLNRKEKQKKISECIIGNKCISPTLDDALVGMYYDDWVYIKIPPNINQYKTPLVYFVSIDYQK